MAMIALSLASVALATSCERHDQRTAERRVERADSAPSPPSPPERAPSSGTPVIVESPPAGAMISSPVRVTGRARGSWYFEAEFPVRLLDAHDTMIGTGVARAQGDWMTSSYVPFEVSIVFHAPAEDSTGILVLEKSNPSGMKEHAADVRVPVRFR